MGWLEQADPGWVWRMALLILTGLVHIASDQLQCQLDCALGVSCSSPGNNGLVWSWSSHGNGRRIKEQKGNTQDILSPGLEVGALSFYWPKEGTGLNRKSRAGKCTPLL